MFKRIIVNHKVFALFLFVVPSYSSIGQHPGDFYSVDTQHSMLDFKIKHIGFGSVRGTFSEYDGTIYFDPFDINKTSASVVINANSIDTHADGRDGILRDEFFQVEKFPILQFISSAVISNNGNYFLAGDLMIGGVKKEVKIPFNHASGPSQDQFKHSRIAFAGSLTLNRRDFDLYYRSNKFWDSIIEDSVYIELEVGARIYNYHDTIFPFRENSVGRIASEAYQSGGKPAAEKKIKDVMANREKYDISFGQMFRGAGYLYQLGDIKGAIVLLDLFMDNSIEIEPAVKSEFVARKAQYNLKIGNTKDALQFSKEALKIDNNTMAMEVLKKSGN